MVNPSRQQLNEEDAPLTLFARGGLWEQAALAKRHPHLQPGSPSASLPMFLHCNMFGSGAPCISSRWPAKHVNTASCLESCSKFLLSLSAANHPQQP